MVVALKAPVIKSLRFTKAELNEIGRQVVRAYQDDIIEMNQRRLFSGKYTNEKFISPDYARFTVDIKKAKGQPTDRVTLKDTGDFYESIYVRAGKDSFYSDATNVKTRALQEGYETPNNILLGMSEADQEEFRELAMDLFVQRYFEKLR